MLKLEQVVSGYGKVEIVHGVTLAVKKGEVVSLIGRNGVGKTTLMKTIMGAIGLTGGKILINGQDYGQKPVYARAGEGIAFVEQGHGIFPELMVEENLRIGLGKHIMRPNDDLRIAYDYFSILSERRRQRASTLSGGEQAMLSIARALVGRPEMILLDEPSEGVQPNVVQQMGEIILKSSKEMNITILIVEQHLKLIQQISDRAYAMDKGVIEGELTREQLLDYNHLSSYLSV